MKILYAVQGTGNGHISRARVMAPALKAQGISVDYMFSGRDKDKYFNMDPFGSYRCYKGFSFAFKQGSIDWLATLKQISIRQFLTDAKSLELDDYDLVLTDFEPIAARAARQQNVKSVGIAHQYAFLSQVPGHVRPGMTSAMIKAFAPVDQSVGLHWHHFEQGLLPPLIRPSLYDATVVNNKIVVYLAFDDKQHLATLFRQWPEYEFHIYTDIATEQVFDNVYLKPFSVQGFQQDLASCDGVICNAGFGLVSEAIQYGKKLLVRPLGGQVEQLSNAQVLRNLGLAVIMSGDDESAIDHWLSLANPEAKDYPDVASVLASWIASGCEAPVSALSETLWREYQQTELQSSIV